MELQNPPSVLCSVLLVVLMFAVRGDFFRFVSKARVYNRYSIGNDLNMSHLKFLWLHLCSLGKNPYVTRYFTGCTLDYVSCTVHDKWDITGVQKYFFLTDLNDGRKQEFSCISLFRIRDHLFFPRPA